MNEHRLHQIGGSTDNAFARRRRQRAARRRVSGFRARIAAGVPTPAERKPDEVVILSGSD